MATVNTFINFPGTCEEAFAFYKEVFKTEYVSEPLRLGEGAPKEVQNMIAHVALPTIGSHVLHGADAPKEMGFELVVGGNIYIMLEPDSRTETDTLFKALSSGGKIMQPLEIQPWGSYYGICVDKFGTKWVFDYIEGK